MARWVKQFAALGGLCGIAALLASSQSPSPLAPPSPPQTTLVAVGDIMLGRRLGETMRRTGDYALPFQNAASLLAADITFGNFEGTFCEKPPWPTSGMVFRIHPEAVKSLLAGGFDVVSIANNHAGDGGDACIRFTTEHLRANGIAFAGAGASYEDAHKPAILERNGVKFAFLAYTYAERNDKDVGTGFSQPPPDVPSGANRGQLKLAPTSKSPKVPRPVIAGRNVQNVQRDVAAARQQANVVIVSLHDGAEYTLRVAKETQEFARAAIDAGAIVVLGHHPHVPQHIEQYNGGWIFYSLGNFVFQQNTPPAVKHALLARLTFTGAALQKAEALAGVIESYARPRPATAEETTKILKFIGRDTSLLWSAPPNSP